MDFSINQLLLGLGFKAQLNCWEYILGVSMNALLKKNVITALANLVKWDNLMMDLAQRIDKAISKLGLST